MTAIERYQHNDFPVLMEQAQMLSKSSIVPQHFRGKPGDVVAAMLLGQELGLGPMATMAHVVVINGTASLNAEGKVALVRMHGHSISGESGATAARVVGRRKDTGDEMVVEWTLKMAERANLLKNPTWRQYPEAMLWSRAVSQLCRMLFPDVLAGLSYTPEEIEAFAPAEKADPAPPVDVETGEVVDAEIVPPPTRRRPPTAAKREPFPQEENPVVPLASDEARAALQARLEAIPMQYRAELTEAWKQAGIVSIKRVEAFTDADAANAAELLSAFEERVAAEAPFAEGEAS
jgi:hypothetical protein